MRRIFFAACVLVGISVHAGIKWPGHSFYEYQVGFSFGLSKISAPLTNLPGTHLGCFVRKGKHMVGVAREHDGEFLKLWGEPTFYTRTGFFYSWMQVNEHFQWGPRIGMGVIECNLEQQEGSLNKITSAGPYGEIGIDGNVNVRGNGAGLKLYFNYNQFQTFVGCAVYLQIGFAWNDKPDKTQAKTGASPTFPSMTK